MRPLCRAEDEGQKTIARPAAIDFVKARYLVLSATGRGCCVEPVSDRIGEKTVDSHSPLPKPAGRDGRFPGEASANRANVVVIVHCAQIGASVLGVQEIKRIGRMVAAGGAEPGVVRIKVLQVAIPTAVLGLAPITRFPVAKGNTAMAPPAFNSIR